MSESVKTPEAEGNTKKEVDKLRLQVHGLWILVVLLAAIIVVPFVYPQKNCSGSNDGIEDIRKQLDEVSKQIDTGLKDLKDELDKNLTDINDVLGKRFTNIKKQLDIFNETIPTIVLDLSEAQNAVKELVTNLTKLNTSVDTNGQTFTKELDKIFELLDNKIKQVTNESSANHALVMKEFEEFMNKSKNLSEDVMKLDKATKEVKELLNETTEVTSLLRSHALNKTNVIILVSIIFFLLFALAFWIYNLHNKVNNKSGTTTTTRKEVLQKLSRPSRLESSVCLIGFNKYMSTFQQNLIKKVLGNIPVTTTVISSHSQLLELPHCRLYVMCIEFSERHVILEEPGLGLGDLKKTTHDVTKKLSDDLIIIYTNDPGSRSLPQGQLYNNNIHCVSSKPELTTLRSLNRFYSIYDKFTDYQIHTLKTTVDNCLEK